MIDLGGFGGANGFSNALNNRGQVIGGSSIPTNPGACFFLNFNTDCHPFLWDQGNLIDLNTSSIGGTPLSADWFNDAGEIYDDEQEVLRSGVEVRHLCGQPGT